MPDARATRVRPRVMIPSAALLFAGCIQLEEQRTLPDVVSWTGWIYGDVPADGVPWLEAGTLEVVDLDEQAVATGAQSESDPGYWAVEVPVDMEVVVRVDGGTQVPTAWRSRTPTGRAYWLSGALFAVEETTQAALFESLEGWQGLSPGDLLDGDVAHLWGTPWEPEAWAGATVEVLDADGSAQVALLAVDADGALIDAGTGPVDLFLAPDLSPGPVTLRVTAADGRVAESTWPARGGDLLSAFYFALPELPTDG